MNASSQLKYCAGYKYQVYEDCWLLTPVKGYRVNHRFFELFEDGRLLVRVGYAWDGASGPTWDTTSSMRSSLGHDVLFQMLRLGDLPHDPVFHLANQFLRDQSIADKMWGWRANLWFKGVEDFGNAFCAVQPDKVYTAP
jgi:hypothetical protein